jgi:hypothetical protein
LVIFSNGSTGVVAFVVLEVELVVEFAVALVLFVALPAGVGLVELLMLAGIGSCS